MGKAAPHVQQAEAELANARAHGHGDAAQAAEKRLAAAGGSPARAAAARRQAADESPEPERQRTAPPRGRTTAPKQTTAPKRPPTSGPGSGVDAWRRYAAAATGEPVETFADLTRDEITVLVPAGAGDELGMQMTISGEAEVVRGGQDGGRES